MTADDHPDQDPLATPSRSIELSIEVPGTPQQVWDAIATGPGITSWFVPFEVDERVGGAVALTFGSLGSEEAVVDAWDPPHRFRYRGPQHGSLAYEWLVEARDGGTCVVRLVNSGFGTGEDWDGQYDGMSEGWQIFLQSLRLHLTHHQGERASALISTVMVPGPHRAAWDTFCQRLGVAGDLDAGDPIRAGANAPALAGRVESMLRTPHATTYLLQLDEPARGTGFLSVEGGGEQVAASLYLYLYDTDPTVGRDWPAWLGEQFPAEPEPQSATPDPPSTG